MKKINIGGKNGLYPSLTTIVGCDIEDKANWLTVAHVGIMSHAHDDQPAVLSIALGNKHHTNKGVRKHGQFSINVPSRELLVKTDYVGLVSGATTDKSDVFTVFRGALAHAPMIAECPLCMELSVIQTFDIGPHEIFIGQVENTYVNESCLVDGTPDLEKIDPILFDFMAIEYWSLGARIGKPWQDGKTLKQK